MAALAAANMASAVRRFMTSRRWVLDRSRFSRTCFVIFHGDLVAMDFTLPFTEKQDPLNSRVSNGAETIAFSVRWCPPTRSFQRTVFLFTPFVISNRATRHRFRKNQKFYQQQHLHPVHKPAAAERRKLAYQRFLHDCGLFFRVPKILWLLLKIWHDYGLCRSRTKNSGPCFRTDVRSTCRKCFVTICATITNPTRSARISLTGFDVGFFCNTSVDFVRSLFIEQFPDGQTHVPGDPPFVFVLYCARAT